MEAMIFVFDGISSREVTGPARVFAEAGWQPRLVSVVPGVCRGFDPYETFACEPLRHDAQPDVLVVPGGFGSHRMAADPFVTRWLRTVGPRAGAVLAVSTGASVVAAAGLGRGRPMTGHWLDIERLGVCGAVPVGGGVVDAGRLVTASGAITAGDAAQLIVDRADGPPLPELLALSRG